MDYQKTKSIIDAEFENEVIPNLSEFIKIDNLSPSFDKEWNTNGKLEQAAKFCLDWALLQGIEGIKGEVIKDADKTPLIFIEIAARNSSKNYMLYGHFDKQPHFNGWAEGLGPITPVIRDGKLYGRGGADDGYSLFSSICSIKTIQQLGGSHGRVVLIVEGSEESGSPHLMSYIEALKDRIGKIDLMVCLDSGALNYDTLWVTTSLRGLAMIDVTVEVLDEAIHSGTGSGFVADSFMILRNILDRIENSQTGRIIDEFQVEIPQKRLEDAQKASSILKEKVLDRIKIKNGVSPLSNDYTQLLLNTTWRPTLTVTGQDGLPPVEIAGNVLRSSTSIRLSVRLPPTLDAKYASEFLDNLIKKDPPHNCKISTIIRHPGSGWSAQVFSDKLHQTLEKSSKNLWGQDYLCFGEGGSIPFIKNLNDFFPECEILVIGVLGPNSNAHCCNEFLHIDYCKNITNTLAHTLNDFAN
jgi:acetylornithine deacetylase/succinyl-diaminopimelate desuccinylase-like protein